MAKSILIRFALLVLMIITPLYAASSWLWKVNKIKISKETFDTDYETFLFLFSMQTGFPLEQVHQIIEINRKATVENKDPAITQLEKKQFMERYEQYIIMQEYIKENKYKLKSHVKQRLRFIVNYYTNQMFLIDQVNKLKFDFSEDFLVKMWVKEKEINPHLETVHISDGLKLMEKKATKANKFKARKKLIENIRKKYKLVRKNKR